MKDGCGEDSSYYLKLVLRPGQLLTRRIGPRGQTRECVDACMPLLCEALGSSQTLENQQSKPTSKSSVSVGPSGSRGKRPRRGDAKEEN